MSPRTVKAVSDMDIDEISLVDRPANQYAAVMIAKNLEGAEMPADNETLIEVFFADGSPVTEDDEVGPEDELHDAEGNTYFIDTDAIEAEANAGQLEAVGKNAGEAFTGHSPRTPLGKSLTQELREELAKSVGDDGTRQILAKALSAVAASESAAAEAGEIAKAERDLRLEREYIEKAASYGALPVDPGELGPVLKRCAEALSFADCAVLNKVFDATGEILFTELGMSGGVTEDGADPMAEADAVAAARLSKGAEVISKEAAREAYFTENPQAYDDYMRDRNRNG